MTTENAEAVVSADDRNETLGESLNRRLEYARKNVLELCEAKAKAEFLGLLNAPRRDIEKMIGW